MPRPHLLGRSIVAFVALPGVVGFLAPALLVIWGASRPAFHPVGLPVLAAGVVLLLWCVRDFHVAGRGTLAPWSPPRHLVTVGLYRFSRNPMYVAVVLILVGWAIGFRSILLTMYLLVVAAMFHLRVILHEEPWLEKHFGDAWVRYKATVPRWIGPGLRNRRRAA